FRLTLTNSKILSFLKRIRICMEFPMSQPEHCHKRAKSNADNNDAAREVRLNTPHLKPPTDLVPGASNKLLSEERQDQENSLKRKASALSNYSKASSFQSFDAHINEWKIKVDRALLEYACNKRKRPFTPERAQKTLQSLYPDLPWNGPLSLLEIFEMNPAHYDLEDANEDTKNFIQLVLKIG